MFGPCSDGYGLLKQATSPDACIRPMQDGIDVDLTALCRSPTKDGAFRSVTFLSLSPSYSLKSLSSALLHRTNLIGWNILWMYHVEKGLFSLC